MDGQTQRIASQGRMLNLKRLNKSSITTQPERVRQMFGSIARRYDLANHVLSCGADFYWRSHAAQIIARWTPENIVDLATGTGDLAVAMRKKSPNAEIVAVDVLAEMLELAKKKGVQRTIMADAMRLPLADSSFDCVTVAFGLRNMENWSGALREMARVLTANGHLLILEFSLPQSLIFRAGYLPTVVDSRPVKRSPRAPAMPSRLLLLAPEGSQAKSQGAVGAH